MRLQVCRMVYEDAEGIGPEDVVSWQEAEKSSGLKLRSVSQLVGEGKLTLLVDAERVREKKTRWRCGSSVV